MYRSLFTVVAVGLMVMPVFAQLSITEIMFDTRSAEPAWEWIELSNSGSVDVDLDGYFLDDISSARSRTSPNVVAAISDSQVTQSVVPAQRVAVLYNGRALDFSAARFRAAWSLDESVPLIAVDGWESLNNGGDAVGLWSDITAYELDLANTDDDDDLEVARLTNAAAGVDFRTGFPSAAGASIEWNGSGDVALAENWTSHSDTSGMVSSATTLDGVAINSPDDVGNPGVVLGDLSSATSLAITEVMYNPASDWLGMDRVVQWHGRGDRFCRHALLFGRCGWHAVDGAECGRGPIGSQ